MFALIKLTFYELRAKAIFIGLFAVATLIWVMLAFALNLDIVDGTLTTLRLFGNEIREGNPSDLSLMNVVIYVQTFVASATYWMGMLLALFATVGLMSGFVEGGKIDLVLSKPLSRSQLLFGRLLGVFAVVFLLLLYLVGMVWVVMGIKTGIWNLQFLNAFLVIFLVFVAMFSIATLVGVSTGSSALSLIITYALIFCSIIFVFPNLDTLISKPFDTVYQGLHFVLPKFAEVTTLVVKLISTEHVGTISMVEWQAFWGTLGFGAVCYLLAFWRFSKKDF